MKRQRIFFKFLLVLGIVCPAFLSGLKAQTSMPGGISCSAASAKDPVRRLEPGAASPLFLTKPINIQLNLPVYTKRTWIKKPVLGRDFNLDISPDFKTRFKFMNKFMNAAEQKFKFLNTANQEQRNS